MQLDKFTGPGSTPSRRAFWNKVVSAVLASEKREGKNVSIDVHDGYGSVINVNPQRAKPPTGETQACCFSDSTCSDLSADDCIAAGGTPRGTGTSCADHGGNGCCTTCENFVDHGAVCTDEDGNCHPIQNCDGTCSGPVVSCADSFWMTDISYCATTGEGCAIQSTNCITSVNPVTCEFTQTGGPCDGGCPEGQTIINSQSVPRIPCP